MSPTGAVCRPPRKAKNRWSAPIHTAIVPTSAQSMRRLRDKKGHEHTQEVDGCRTEQQCPAKRGAEFYPEVQPS